MTALDRQLAGAAALAGMAPPTSTVEARARRIAADVAPTIAAAIGAELDKLREAKAARTAEDEELFQACRAVGAAIDRV